jgi:hypothetical protein
MQGYETKDRNVAFEQRKAFQRLIYVSQVCACVRACVRVCREV